MAAVKVEEVIPPQYLPPKPKKRKKAAEERERENEIAWRVFDEAMKRMAPR